jgi:biotin carboxyl carrier protein
MIKYQALVNGVSSIEIEGESLNNIRVNGQETSVDILPTQTNSFSILINNTSYNGQCLSINKQTKSAVLLINNQEFKVDLKDGFDLMLNELGMGLGMGKKINDVKAPMPGLVLSVSVEVGQEIKEGEPLMILEAMKMENVIVSPCDAVISSVNVVANDKVDKNQILVGFEA